MTSSGNGWAFLKPKRLITAFVVWVSLTLGVAGTAAAGSTIKVGTWKTPQTIQPFYYQEFLSPPSRCEVFAFTNPADQKTALLAGSLDMCGTTLAHAIHSASQGQPVVVVAALCNKCSALVVRTDGTVNRVSDLKGKRIGYVPGTMHEILLRETLTRTGLNPARDVSLIRVDFFDMGLALARGGIDAFLSGEPFPTMAVAEGYGRVLAYPYYDDTVGSINAGMLVTRKSITENPDLVYRLVKAHARATRYLNRHPDQWLQKAASFGTPVTILKKAAANIELAWDMDAAFIQKAKALGARMQALKVIDRQPDYERLFDLQFVKRVQAEGFSQ
jgi:NitT/TauT family transport system substrate-binding protein